MFQENKSTRLMTQISLKWWLMLMLFIVGLSLELPAQVASFPKTWNPFLVEAEKLGAEQLLLVSTSAPGVLKAEVHCLERHADGWKSALPVMDGSVGRNGIADPGAKREGDGMTPYGVYPVGMAFGYLATYTTKMPYRQMQKEDIWVDDSAAADYNKLTSINSSSAKSFEHMRRKDDLYKLGLVVEYNTDPVVPGLGSAIFIHIRRSPAKGTAGCLALSEVDIESVLGFLNPAKSPAIAFFRND
ncbi:MAG: L,D-transpeptidase family protein [Candidatus Riflebacteria bacterium]|nr:L,D-transpeptidase family protein [Candidatus Riflebacteria bacterium]